MKRQLLAAAALAQLLLLPNLAAAKSVKAINDYIPCQLNLKQDAEMRNEHPRDVALAAEVGKQSAFGAITDRANFLNAIKSSRNFEEAFNRAAPYIADGPNTQKAVKSAIVIPFNLPDESGNQRPKDIACSQSLLSWDEASDILGRRIARTYLVFQVTVRNLSPDDDFIVQDVKIAQNSPYTRFVDGRDKLLARGVALRGQSADPRNAWIRIGDAAAATAGAATTVFTGVNYRNAVSIFASAFLPGMKTTFPDYTIDQLNRLNDLAFSSSSTSKIVVPKRGSVPFVTFLPTKIFAGDGTNKPLPYKRWSQPQLLAFSNSTYVIIAGAHIKEVDSEPSIGKLSCPDANIIDLSKAAGDTVTCDVTGANLDDSLKLRLRNATESNDKTTAEGTLTSVSKDSTTTKLVFKLDDLKALTGIKYMVYLVQDSTDEATTGLSITIKNK